MKLSVQLICIFLSVTLFYSPLEAKPITPENTPESACLPPGLPVITDITSVSARLSWTSAEGALLYEWKIGVPGFLPDLQAIFSGTSTDTSELVVSLASATNYAVYVRSSCDGLMFSDWVGQVTFSTAPGCGDVFYDSGGPFGVYQDAEKTITTICPDLPIHVVSLDFSLLKMNVGDTMQIFDGTSINDFLINTYVGIVATPFTVTATNPSGCLTVQFNSDLLKVDDGWVADIECAVPTTCFPVQEINVFNLQPTGANFSWPDVFDAFAYQWEIRTMTNTLVASGLSTDNSVTVSGLSEATNYVFRALTLCNLTGDSPQWTSIQFFTPINCANKPVINCGETRTSSSSGFGVWETSACTYATPGQERIFRFTAPQTRMYTFQTVSGSSAVNAFVTYGYKESSLGCGPFDWNCIGSFNVTFNTETAFGPLIAGKEYLILFDAETTSAISHSFRIKDCGPPNDEALNAVPLIVDKPCLGNIYSNTDATFNLIDSLGLEPNPDGDTDLTDQLSGRWLSPADETVWFKFKAPASGSVIISTESIPQGGNFDTQLAMYRTSDSTEYKYFELIVSDDDNGDGGLGYNSVFTYSGLEPESTYYIQVDGYGIVSGNFCIEVLEDVIRYNENECNPNYFTEKVDGTADGGDRWYNVFSRPDILDLGDLLIGVKPGFQNLDTVFCQMNVVDTTPVYGVIPYLPTYLSVRTTAQPVMPYKVRLFFHQAEFDSLVVESHLDPLTTTIEDLVVTQYVGPEEDCSLANNSYEFSGGPGVATLITDVKSVYIGNSDMFYVEFEMFPGGEIGVHFGQTTLPIELKSFTGKIADKVNRLEWTTQTEKNVAWHLIERSADGTKWTEIGRLAGQINALFPTAYVFDDVRPLPKSYYRLRSLDYDGLSILSSIVVLNRRDATFGIERVFPSPTQDRLNVDFNTVEETDVTIRVSDITGHIVLEQHSIAAKGRHNANLSLQSLPAGIYIVSLSDGVSVATPVRVVKK